MIMSAPEAPKKSVNVPTVTTSGETKTQHEVRAVLYPFRETHLPSLPFPPYFRRYDIPLLLRLLWLDSWSLPSAH